MAQYGEGDYGKGVYGVGESGGPPPPDPTKPWVPSEDESNAAEPLADDEASLPSEMNRKANKWRPRPGEALLTAFVQAGSQATGNLTRYRGLSVTSTGKTTIVADLSASAIKDIAAASAIAAVKLNGAPVLSAASSATVAIGLRPAYMAAYQEHSKIPVLLNGAPQKISASITKAALKNVEKPGPSSLTVKTAASIPGNLQTAQSHIKITDTNADKNLTVAEHAKMVINSAFFLPDIKFMESEHMAVALTNPGNLKESVSHAKTVYSPVRMYEWYVMQDSPEGYWKLDDGPYATQALDSSGNGHHATVNPIYGYSGDTNGVVSDSGEPLDVSYGSYIAASEWVDGNNDGDFNDGYYDEESHWVAIDYSRPEQVLAGDPLIVGYGYSDCVDGTSSGGSPSIESLPPSVVVPGGETPATWGWMEEPSFTLEGWFKLDPYVRGFNHIFGGRYYELAIDFRTDSSTSGSGSSAVTTTTTTITLYFVHTGKQYTYQLGQSITVSGSYTDGSATIPYSNTSGADTITKWTGQPNYIAITNEDGDNAGTVSRLYINNDYVVTWHDVPDTEVVLSYDPVVFPNNNPDNAGWTLPLDRDYDAPNLWLGPVTYTDTGWVRDEFTVISDGSPMHVDSTLLLGYTPYENPFGNPDVHNYIYKDAGGICVAHLAFYPRVLSYGSLWTHWAAGSGNWSTDANRYDSQEHIKLLPAEDPNRQNIEEHAKVSSSGPSPLKVGTEGAISAVMLDGGLSTGGLQSAAEHAKMAEAEISGFPNAAEHIKIGETGYDYETYQIHDKSALTTNPDIANYHEHIKITNRGGHPQETSAHVKTTQKSYIPEVIQSHIKVTSSPFVEPASAAIQIKMWVDPHPPAQEYQAHVKAAELSAADGQSTTALHVVSAVEGPYKLPMYQEHMKTAELSQSLGINYHEHTKAAANLPGQRKILQQHTKISESEPWPWFNATERILVAHAGVAYEATSSSRLVVTTQGISDYRVGSAHYKAIPKVPSNFRSGNAHLKTIGTVLTTYMSDNNHVKLCGPYVPNLKRGWGILL